MAPHRANNCCDIALHAGGAAQWRRHAAIHGNFRLPNLLAELRRLAVTSPPQNCPSQPPRHDEYTASTSRKPYAPAALGHMPPARNCIAPARTDFVNVANYFHVTNLGTLIDVLA